MIEKVLLAAAALYLGGCASHNPPPLPANMAVLYAGEYAGNATLLSHRGEQSYMLTAWHVIDPEHPSVVRMDEDVDLAIVKVPRHPGRTLRLADSVSLGERVWCWTGYDGMAVLLQGTVANPGLGLLDLDVLGGNSGGAVLNDRGELVGVLVAGYEDGSLSVMVHVDTVREFLR